MVTAMDIESALEDVMGDDLFLDDNVSKKEIERIKKEFNERLDKFIELAETED